MSLFALAHQSYDSAVRYANSSRTLQPQHGLDSSFGYPPINRLYANSKHLSNFCTSVEFQLCVLGIQKDVTPFRITLQANQFCLTEGAKM